MAQVEFTPAYVFDPQVKEVRVEQLKEYDEGYMTLLVKLSLLLARKDFPLEVQGHGAKMIEHLLKFRHEEISSADLLLLVVELEPIGFPNEAKMLSRSENSKEKKKHTKNLHIFSQETGGVQNENEGPPRQSISVLSFDEQVNYDESEHEVQRLMAIDISDNKSQDHLPDIVHPQLLRFYGKKYGHQIKGCLLLAEHNILCQAFVLIACLRKPEHKNVLHYILSLLNTIWNQSEWDTTFLCNGFGLSCLFCDNHFLKMVHNMVKLLGNELKASIEGRSGHDYFISFLHWIIPLLLQLLRCIHSLWKDQIAGNLFQELERAKTQTSEDLETTKLLEEIREIGYNMLGLCMSLEGAFTILLNSSSFIIAFTDFESMEFRHLSKVICAVFVPLVRYCPCEVWKEWMLDLLRPLLTHCEQLSHCAWFSLLHEGRAKVPYYFGKISGSADNIEALERSALFEFTRAVCQLLANISSPESSSQKIITQHDPEYMASNSLLRYLLGHGCFWSLRVSLFGYWVDGEAAREGIHFCRALIRLAGVTNDERFKFFLMDELLPSLIKCIDDELPCAFRKSIHMLNSSVSIDVEKDLIILCRELYDYLSSNFDAQIQDILEEDEDIHSAADNFACWLTKQKKYLRAKANDAPPKEFNVWKSEWHWEFEDEFRRYLPLYIDMLKEVDAIEGSSKVDYSDWEILEKLNPEFRSKNAINSVEHPHFLTISRMRRRKFYSKNQVGNHTKMFALISKLITHEPYIKGSDRFDSVVDRLEQNPEIQSMFDSCDLAEAVHVLLDLLLYIWEPQFHPIIRKGNKELLVWIIEQLIKGKEFEDFQPLGPDPEDFPSHLKPYAMSYIMTRLNTSMYAKAEKQLQMHQDCDNILASGKLDDYICQCLPLEDDLSTRDVARCVVPLKPLTLDHNLFILSLKRRASIVKFSEEARTYSECLRILLSDDSLKYRLTNLMSELEVEGFFDVDNGQVNWEKKRFTELVDRFKDEVFNGCSLPRHYVIRGIIDYRTILLQKDPWGAFEKVVGEAHGRLSAYLPQFWRDTRHYKHYFYDIAAEPLEKIFV